VLNDSVWGMKITALEESVDFATLDPEKLFSKLKSHELFRKSRPNHDASHFSKALISSARVGGHDANPTNTIDSSTFEFVLSSLAVAFDEQYKSISNDEIALLARKLCVLHRFHKERRSSTSSPTAPSGRSSTPPLTCTTTTTGMTPSTRARARRSTASGIRRRSSRR
jgi:hypothetical protein